MSVEGLLGELRAEIAEQRAEIARIGQKLDDRRDWVSPVLYTKRVAAGKLSVSVGKLQQMIDAGLLLVTWLDDKRKSARIHRSEIDRLSEPQQTKAAARLRKRKVRGPKTRSPTEEAAALRKSIRG